jgi:hypothetical protein
MGADGVGFINSSVSDIDAMASGLGSSIATASVGTLVQNQQTYNLNVGDVTLAFDATGSTLTTQDVQSAIDVAFRQFASSVSTQG